MWITRAYYEKLVVGNRDDMVMELRRQVARLEDQLKHALDKADREQTRADNALDNIAVQHGIAPVSPAPAPSAADADPFAEDPVEVEMIRQEIKERGLVETLLSRK